MLRLSFRAFDNRAGGEVSADAFTLHQGNLEAWFEAADRVGERYGPFDGLSCVDGVLWAGSDAIAALKNGEWASMVTKRAWPKLRLAFPSQAGLGAAIPAKR